MDERIIITLRTYEISNHINNIDFLENIINATIVSNEKNMFKSINRLADFLSDNIQYTIFISYNNTVDMVVDTIEFCNSEKYDFEQLFIKYNEIIGYIKKLLDEIENKFSINIYFSGLDKYSMIDKIINKKGIKLNKYERFNDEIYINDTAFNVLVISEETCNQNINLNDFDYIIYYDKFMNSCYNIVDNLYHSNILKYDYNYLNNSIDFASDNNVKSIIVGHSYSLNGINETELNSDTINFSLSSQDLYYSYKIARKAIDSNRNISRCYIGTGYWSFYFDLSKTLNSVELDRIKFIYYPIFNDGHNYLDVDKGSNMDDSIYLKERLSIEEKCIFDTNKIYTFLSKIIFLNNKKYFNDRVSRELFSMIGNRKLYELAVDTKFEIGKQRAEAHNKLLKHTSTRSENEAILREFIGYLNKKNVEAIIVNFPTTHYYNNYLDFKFKEEYYRIFKDMENDFKFKLIDLNSKHYNFDDKDYRDVDHINIIGAKKICSFLFE